MRLPGEGRTRDLLRRFPHVNLLRIAEVAFIALLAIQCVRLIWVVIAPIGPVGNWRGEDRLAAIVANRDTLLTRFDPFFRAQEGAAAVITSLQLTLYGTRLDEINGRGSAIIASADGVQTSYAVGDEILPGVTLKSVAFDHVTIDRGGVNEQIYIDQSGTAPIANTANPDDAESDTDTRLSQQIRQAETPLSPSELRAGIQLVPRTDRGRVTGFVLRSVGDGSIFRRAGFQEGDILVSAEGKSINSAQDAQRIAAQIRVASNLSVQVERGANVVPIAIAIAGE